MEVGIDRFFINSGTEYASLLLDYCVMDRAERPEMVVCLSETTAVSAAYGYYLGSGKVAAVLVHTVPGILNALPNIFNAKTADIPILLISGITSFSAKGYAGSKKIRVHWGQDIRDVQCPLQQFVKWSYVVKTVEEIPEAVVRAVEIATSKPEGPVYIGIHREWLFEKANIHHKTRRRAVSPPSYPDPSIVKKVAEKLVKADFPVVLTRSAGRDPRAFHLLTSLAEKICVRVSKPVGEYVNIANTNIFSAEFDISRADFILVLDTDVPWLPAEKWPEDAYRVSVGSDPLRTSLNIWGYNFDEAIQSETTAFLDMLLIAINDVAGTLNRDKLDERRMSAAEDWRRQREEKDRMLKQDMGRKKLTKRFASHIVGKAIPRGAVFVNEYPLKVDFVEFETPGSYFGEPPAGSLGWGFGAALGIKMASPSSFLAVVLGDGSFVFNNPVSAAALSRWYQLPLLVLVFNDGSWGDVKKSVSDSGADPNEIGFLEGADFPEPLDIYSIGKGLGFSSYLVEKPDEAANVLKEAVFAVSKGQLSLVDIKVTADF